MSAVAVVDSSALLAIAFREADSARVVAAMKDTTVRLMSAVNLAEVVMTSARRNPARHDTVLKELKEMDIEIVPALEPMAFAVADAKVQFPKLNFGDTFCYALAKERGLPILTLDADFATTDARLVPLP